MGLRILIVDDEPSILRSTAMLLASLGYEVGTCDRAEAIVEAVRRERPDVLLQDLRMPGLDLERAVLELRAIPEGARLPIVIFTASMEAAEICERIGGVGILDKPFRPHELEAALRVADDSRGEV